MTTKKFNNWLNEDSTRDQSIEITPELISKLEDATGLDKWRSSKYFSDQSTSQVFGISNLYSDRKKPLIYPDVKVPSTLRIAIPTMNPSNIRKSFMKIEDLLEVNIIPDYLMGMWNIIIEFVEDPNIRNGSVVMEDLKRWDDRHKITFRYKANNYTDLVEVIKKGLDEAFEFLKDVRIVIPADIKKIPGVKAYMGDKIREIYNQMLDEVRENGEVEGELDDNIFAQLIISILDEHPNLIDDFNNLPERAKNKWLAGVKEIFPEGDIEISKKSIETIKAFLNVKKSFYLI
jgi:hypothetical protein